MEYVKCFQCIKYKLTFFINSIANILINYLYNKYYVNIIRIIHSNKIIESIIKMCLIVVTNIPCTFFNTKQSIFQTIS